MSLRSTIFVLVILYPIHDSVADDSLIERARASFSNILYEPLAVEIEDRLKDNGVSSAEVNRKIEAAVDGIARCFVDLIDRQTGEEFEEVLILMADGKDDAELKAALGEAYEKIGDILNHQKSEFDACCLDVQRYLGIPGDSLFSKAK